MKAVVTGGAGFIGRALVESLLDSGFDVLVVDSGDTGQLGEVPPSAELVERDIGGIEVTEWLDLMSGAEFVFHLAARKYNTPGVTPTEILDTNVAATWKIAEAAATARVKRLVFTSSLYAYGGLGPDAMQESQVPLPTTLYGASKLMGEHMLRTLGKTSGLSWGCARLFFIYGPGQHAEGGYKSVIVSNFGRLNEGLAPIIRGDGQQSLDYVYVSDAIAGLMALANAELNGITVNISSGVPSTIESLTGLMQQTAGTSLPPEYVDADWTQGTRRFGDPALAANQLSWSAAVPLEAGLAQTWSSLTT